MDWLRPQFNSVLEGYWETTKLAYRLYPQLVTLTQTQVSKAITDLLPNRTDLNLQLLDNSYRTYPQALFNEIIKDDQSQRSLAMPEINDCDNYGWLFKSNMQYWYHATAVGFVLDQGAGHVYNVIVFADGTASLFEPQQDRYVAPGKAMTIFATGSKRYDAMSALIIT